MSLEAMSWAKKLSHDPAGQKLLRTEKIVLVMLADAHNEHTRLANPSLAELQVECLISKPGLIAALKSLKDRGLITVSKVDDNRGWSLRNEYTFPVLDAQLARGKATLPLPQDVGSKATLPGGKLGDVSRGKATLPQEKSSSPESGEKTLKNKDTLAVRIESTPGSLPQPVDEQASLLIDPDASLVTVPWVIAEWNKIDGVMPMDEATGPVLQRLEANIRAHPLRAWWRDDHFAKVAASLFLTGQTADWSCDLYWSLGPKNRAKLLAGNYRNKPQAPATCVWSVRDDRGHGSRPCKQPASPTMVAAGFNICADCEPVFRSHRKRIGSPVPDGVHTRAQGAKT